MTDVCTYGDMKLHALVEMLLNAACRAADDLGFGISELNSRNKSWVLARLQLAIDSYPRQDEDVEIETWIEQNRFSFSTRNFRVWRLEGNGTRTQLVHAKSIWAVIDLDTRENVNLFDEPLFRNAVDGEPLHLPLTGSKPSRDLSMESEYTVRYSDLDFNGHCNSARYLQIMLNAYNRIDGCQARFLNISYSREVHFGDSVTIRYNDSDSPTFHIYNADGKLCTSAFFFNE